MCEHKFAHLRTESFWRNASRYSREYICVDYFFCEKCLEEQTKKKVICLNDHEIPQKLPDWATMITEQVRGYE